MARKCELCASLETRTPAPESAKAVKLRRILIESRVVALCEPHAVKVRAAAPSTLAELRQLFPEPGGKRSLLERRAPLDRRIFPARPEGRRARAGRRSGDAA